MRNDSLKRRRCVSAWNIGLTGHLFSAPTSRRPFGHNPLGAAKAACLHSTPQFRAVAATGSPLCIENRQEGLQCVFSRTKNVGLHPPNDLAHQATTVAEATDDFLNRNADGVVVLGRPTPLERGQKQLKELLNVLRAGLPFALRSLEVNSGCKFINNKLIAYCIARGIELTR